MQEALILEMQSWLAAHGLSVGIAAAEVTEGWDTSSEIEALGDERTNAFFMTGNGLVQRALPFQDVPIASSYDQSSRLSRRSPVDALRQRRRQGDQVDQCHQPRGAPPGAPGAPRCAIPRSARQPGV